MSERVTFLHELGKLDANYSKRLLKLGRRENVLERTVIARQGTEATSVLILLSGRVVLIDHSHQGKDVFIGAVFPGQILAEADTLRRRSPGMVPRFRFTAKTLEESKVLVIPGDRFTQFLNYNVEAWPCVARDIQTRLDTAEFRIALAGAPARKRLARVLTYLMDHTSTVKGVNQGELAAWIGASRRTVERELASLKDEGIVWTSRGAPFDDARDSGTIHARDTGRLAYEAGVRPPNPRPPRRTHVPRTELLPAKRLA